MSIDNRDFINELARVANLVSIAEKCGMTVVHDGSHKPRACCPFHDDHRPSLQFYPNDGSSDRDYFHCFACGAHGDIFTLVKELRNLDFWDAVQWVATECRVDIPRSKQHKVKVTLPLRQTGLQEAEAIYRQQNRHEQQLLADFGEKRGFDPVFLATSEVFAARGNKIVAKVSGDRELQEALQEAGTIVQSQPVLQGGASKSLPMPRPPRDLFSTDRIVFTIRGDDGNIVGFAGRAISEESPKYLFTKHLPKGDTLYRLDRVLKTLRSHRKLGRRKAQSSIPQVFHLFIVEGLLDALRLESLALNAVAVLGSQMTQGQVELIGRLAEEVDRRGLQLAVHLFFDADIAGRNGMMDALPKIFQVGAAGVSFGVDVIVCTSDESSTKHDPDDLLLESSTTDGVMARMAHWCHSALDFLLAEGLGTQVERLPIDWPRTEVSLRMRAMRFVERQLDGNGWTRVLDRLAPFEPWLRPETNADTSDWQDQLNRFLRATPSVDKALHKGEDTSSKPYLERTDDGRLLHALQLSQASTQRRELPVDESSWTRLELAWDVVTRSLAESLSIGSERPEPMVSVKVPRGDGDFRLKALPMAEDLIMQQYVLYELLREVPNSRFLDSIPAVRFQNGMRAASLRTTGPANLRPVNGRTVSFAYQIDMDVLEGRTPPRRDGMFRPYYDCWTDFISFIDRHVGSAQQSEFYVARLDIRRFYDSLPRHAVHDVLFPSLRDALEILPKNGSSDTIICASLFRPELTDADKRARGIVDWLCEQSFGYCYLDPRTGKPNISQPLERGVPQGPDLSAYLANIALFPLDRALSDMALKIDGVYARYVDDMVIIAPTERDLALLRAQIEDGLSRLGLELSTKTKPLPPMRRDDVREWLTDNRGGLGVSGPFAGPPINEPLTALEPLGDAGELDRSHALTLLHDPRLIDPDTSATFIFQTVTTVQRAAHLRFSESVKSSSILWSRVLDSSELDEMTPSLENGTPIQIARRFRTFWDQTARKISNVDSDQSNAKAKISRLATRLMAWIDGLEAYLHRRYDHISELSNEKLQRVVNRQEAVAALVHLGLCTSLQSLIAEEGGQAAIDHFRHMFDLKVLAVHIAASKLIQPASPNHEHYPTIQDPSPAQLRFLLSLAELQGNLELIRHLSHSGTRPEFSFRLLFHDAIVRLSTKSLVPNSDPDPLERLRQPITEIVQELKSLNTIPVLLRVLQLWLPSASDQAITDAVFARDAVLALVRISSEPADVLMKRPGLAKVLLSDGHEPTCELIPSPAGIGMPGIMGREKQTASTSEIIKRVDFRSDATCCPSTLNWLAITDDTSQTRRWQTELVNRHLLFPLNQQPDAINNSVKLGRDQLPLWLATAYEGLVRFCQRENNEDTCPPTAYNLIGPAPGTPAPSDSCWEILSHKVQPQNFIGQAFRRTGSRGLIAEPIKEHHADLWRIGTALADCLCLVEDSRRQASFHSLNTAWNVDHNDDWALETLLRVALFRLRGISLPARALPVDEKSELKLPRTITRILDCLKAFPSQSSVGDHWRRIAMLLAHLAENRAFVVRYDSSHRLTDLSTPGAAVALVLEISRHQFRADETLAHELPPSSVITEDTPKRRPVLAWYLMADRVHSLAKQSSIVDPECGEALLPLIVGSRIMSVTLQLRMQTLEYWISTKEPTWDAFVAMPPDLTPWNLDNTALLHINQGAGRNEPVDKEGDVSRSLVQLSNVQFLFSQLASATEAESANIWEGLAGITSLGWCVALGTILGFLRGPYQKVIVTRPSDLTSENEEDFCKLAQWLAVEVNEGDDVPWGDLKSVLTLWNAETTRTAFSILSQIDSACGMIVKDHESPHFRIADGRKSSREVCVSDGDRDIFAWQIVSASAQREFANRGAERFRSANDDRWWYRWTETRRKNQLLSIGTVQPGLALLAGLQESLQPGTEPRSADPINSTNDGSGDAHVNTANDLPGIAAEPNSFLESDTTGRSLMGERPAPTSSSWKDADEAFSRYQSQSWKQRQKLGSHLRIALFQWDVDDSYRHPLFDACMLQQDERTKRVISEARKKGQHHLWTSEHANRQYDQQVPGLLSCAEHRRIEMLKVALRACREFKVEVLLLPEYSVRPDTVRWLRTELAADPGLTTWVWAGTYRRPPYPPPFVQEDAQEQIADWTSILSLVWKPQDEADAKNEWCIRRRKKKYPAIGMGEQFAPSVDGLSPMLGSSLDLRSKILELICSEVFIVTSPSNLYSTASAYRALLRKFGMDQRNIPLDEINDYVVEDIRDFGEHTSIIAHPYRRRSILLVPAMTPRTVDYAILGQAGYLAAGLTTVFCNAAKGNGYGQSCFIGHDGWDKEEKGLIGLPGTGPYHGVLPGIYCPFRPDRGWLGIKEQALVIADVDPFYSTEGSPRPQLLPHPLQLVAHLPIIESWNYKEPDEAQKHLCRCKRATAKNPSDIMDVIAELIALIPRRATNSTVGDNAPAELAVLLKKLSDLAGHKDGDWLERRRKAYLSDHAANPQPWPPPVALDWLWVDLGNPGEVEFPSIQVPPYSLAPGEDDPREVF